MLDERLAKWHFWATLIGFHTTFLVQHWLGAEGMPRRYADYLDSDGFTVLNQISSVGSFILGIAMLPFIWNIISSWRYGEIVTVDVENWDGEGSGEEAKFTFTGARKPTEPDLAKAGAHEAQ